MLTEVLEARLQNGKLLLDYTKNLGRLEQSSTVAACGDSSSGGNK